MSIRFCVQKRFCIKKILGQKIFWVKKNRGPKKFKSENILSQTFLVPPSYGIGLNMVGWIGGFIPLL